MPVLTSRLAHLGAGRTSLLIRLAGVVLAVSVTTACAEPPARLQEAERLMRAGEYDAAQAMLPDLPSQSGEERYRGLMLHAEMALAQGHYERANRLYQQANLAAGEAVAAELGQVHADLQAGEFRRAKAFATLIAGEHLDAPEALALSSSLLLRTLASGTGRAVVQAGDARFTQGRLLWIVGRVRDLERGRVSDQGIDVLCTAQRILPIVEHREAIPTRCEEVVHRHPSGLIGLSPWKWLRVRGNPTSEGQRYQWFVKLRCAVYYGGVSTSDGSSSHALQGYE